ncbi:MAG: ACP S-malonyltransferase [Nitrospirota bacterium]|nr:MAG: ACP S-malonyltransferase [Nitrospirota bacterium]
MNHSVGYLFPGQGSQSVGMGRALYEADSKVRALYEKANRILGYDLTTLCFDGPADQLNLTEYTQPALLVTSLGALQLFQHSNLQPQAVAGHSLGEYTAVVAAQGLNVDEAIQLVQKRGRYMADAVVPGSGLVVAVIGSTEQDVRQACEEAGSSGIVAPANFNCPGQVVVAGEKAAVEKATDLLKQRGVRKILPLAVSVPVHTPLMQPAADRLKKDIDSATWSDLKVPLINNAQAHALLQSSDVRVSLVRQLPSSVLWEHSIRKMREMGISVFIEIGPGKVLTGLVKRILPEATTFNVFDMESFEAMKGSLSNS